MALVGRLVWLLRNPPAEWAKWYIGRTVSHGTRRGRPANDDGKITLLTVNWRMTDDVLRLARSFHQFVDPDGQVVVVQNSRGRRKCRRAGLTNRGFGLNLYHGPALDWGMRSVVSEYVLICDPDCVIINERFVQEVRSRLADHGVAGVRISKFPQHAYYHPICLAFPTRLWKEGRWSLDADWNRTPPNDAASALTHELGGLNPAALLPKTHSNAHAYVYADCFSATFAGARVAEYDEGDVMDGHASVSDRIRYHALWRAWADRVVEGRASVEEFPPGPANPGD